jgi:signal transduction histidine kinase
VAGLDAVRDKVRGAGLPVMLTVTGAATPLTPGTDLTTYRIIQEALTNSLRHARASRAEVTLAYEPGFVTVRVTDDGLGPADDSSPPPGDSRQPGGDGHQPDVTTPGPSGQAVSRPGLNGGAGFGLAGIAERVASCGGSLAVGPTGSGFAVTARLPTP